MTDDLYQRMASSIENATVAHELRKAADRLNDMAERVEKGDPAPVEVVNTMLEHAEGINEL